MISSVNVTKSAIFCGKIHILCSDNKWSIDVWVNNPSKIVSIYTRQKIFLEFCQNAQKIWKYYKKDDIISRNIFMFYSHFPFFWVFNIDMTSPYQNLLWWGSLLTLKLDPKSLQKTEFSCVPLIKELYQRLLQKILLPLRAFGPHDFVPPYLEKSPSKNQILVQIVLKYFEKCLDTTSTTINNTIFGS